MAGFSALALVGGLALGAAGTVMQFQGMKEQKEAAKRASAASARAEQQRQEAQKLDAQRRTREAIRQSYVARGAALNQSASEGSQFGSGIQGQFGNIATQSRYNIAGIQGQKDIGGQLHAANMAYGAAQANYSEAGSTVAMGAGLSSLGGAFVKNIGAFDRLGRTIFA